jgi:hypothetical protein
MKYIGPLLFALGVIIAISGGAKVPDSKIKEAEEKIAKKKADEKGKPKDEKPNELKPKTDAEVQATALANIAKAKAKKKAEEDAKANPPATKEIKFEMPDTKWYFTVGIVFAGTGLGLWWKDVFAARQRDSDADSAESSGNPIALLREATDTLSSLKLVDPTSDEICAKVDEILSKTVMPMIEVRQRLIDSLGMNVGAEVLVVAAAGERLLNRAWSAAADGDIPEALESIRKSGLAFAEAQEVVDNAT